jgi:hypothetical protein
MDYNLEKWIEPSFFTPQQNQHQRLTSFPTTDFVNPGIGGVVRLYSIYRPLHSSPPIHSIDKKMDLSLEQEGFGETNEPSENKNE